MDKIELSDNEYQLISELLYIWSGVSLGKTKKILVASRLLKRIQNLGLLSYRDYFDKLVSAQGLDERQIAIDLLTTHETYFFREAKHLNILKKTVQSTQKSKAFRVWSAACASGEEAYTIAISLQELKRSGHIKDWAVYGSDLSSRVLDQARSGLYKMDRMDGINPELMKRYFLKGSGPYEGYIMIDKILREKTEFSQINLIEPLPTLMPFDAIFLRNVMIYFDLAAKRKVVTQVLSALKPQGILFVGISESLHGVMDGLIAIGPGAYLKT